MHRDRKSYFNRTKTRSINDENQVQITFVQCAAYTLRFKVRIKLSELIGRFF